MIFTVISLSLSALLFLYTAGRFHVSGKEIYAATSFLSSVVTAHTVHLVFASHNIGIG